MHCFNCKANRVPPAPKFSKHLWTFLTPFKQSSIGYICSSYLFNIFSNNLIVWLRVKQYSDLWYNRVLTISNVRFSYVGLAAARGSGVSSANFISSYNISGMIFEYFRCISFFCFSMIYNSASIVHVECLFVCIY